MNLNPTVSRRSALAASAFGVSAILAGCKPEAQKQEGASDNKDQKKLSIVASFYPMYDFAKRIAGDYAEVTCLVPAGTEPHDWEPSSKDMKTIQEADFLIYNGAGMEHWVKDVLDGLGSGTKLVAVETSKDVKLLELEEEDDHDHDHEEKKDDHDHDHDHDHGGTDPHVWLSPLNAKIQMKNICDALSEKDSEHKTEYAANLDKANADFDTLDSEFHKGLDSLPNKTIVVSHQAFGYLCEAYGLTQMPIEGVEADAEPNAQEMKEITEFVKEHNVKVIFTEELVSPKVAQAIAEATGARVEELNPLEGLTDEELKAGEDYLSVMRDNLKALEGALA